MELFRVLNYAVAQHLAEVPVALPDLAEVLAEVARTGFVSDPPAIRLKQSDSAN